MNNSGKKQYLWIIVYLAMNIAALAIWTAWYSQSRAYAIEPNDYPPRETQTFKHDTPIRAVLLLERSVYHCGETLTVCGLVRDEALQSVAGMPLEISLVNEEGRMVDQSEVWTDEAGRVSVNTTLSDDSLPGLFLVEAKLPGHSYVVGETMVRIDPCPRNQNSRQ